MIYLDNAATTFPKPECVYRAVDECLRTGAVNAGRGSYRAAREAGAMIARVKERLVGLADARGQADVVLTYSATVALNELIGGQRWRAGDVAYVSPYEHNAVLRPLELARRRHGVEVVQLPLAPDLSIDLGRTAEMFAARPPRLVCVTAASNVTGYILPAREVFALAKPYGAFALLDASQAFGLVKLRFGELRADALVFAGHKTLYATFGAAGFLLRRGAQLDEYVAGGNGKRSLSVEMPPYLPDKLESSSLDTPALAGLEAALGWLGGQERGRGQGLLGRERELAARLTSRLRAIPGVVLYPAPGGPAAQTGVVSFNVEGLRANEVGAVLDHDRDIAVRCGHHCAAYIHEHLRDAPFDGTVRASVGAFTTEEDVDALADAVEALDRRALESIPQDVLRGNC